MDNSTIQLLSGVPLYNDYNNTLSWGTQTDQYNYFYGKRVTSIDMSSCSYQRKDGIVKVNAHFDDVVKVNYVMYRNSEQSNKWYYAFVVDTEYVSDGSTLLYLETDVMQTYYFDWTLHPSYVQREHVSNDTVGAHTYPESLEFGEYVCLDTKPSWSKPGDPLDPSNYIDINNVKKDLYVVIGTTAIPYIGYAQNGYVQEQDYVYFNENEGITSGWSYSGYKLNAENVEYLKNFFKILDRHGKIEGVSVVYIVPEFMVDEYNEVAVDSPSAGTYYIKKVRTKKYFDFQNKEQFFSARIKRNSSLQGYTPKNNKLLCYPYTLLYGTNRQGQNCEYRWEDFDYGISDYPNHFARFNLKYSINENSKPMLVPVDYKRHAAIDDENYDYAISLPAYNQCGWSSDPYLAWIAQNGASLALNALTAVAGTAATAVTGGLASPAMASGLASVAGDLVQLHKANIAPPSAHGNSGSNTLQIIRENWFEFKVYSIKEEYARIIDNFFEVYGYKVCTVKTPNIRTRPQWNYIKTVDVTITGAIHPKDLKKICSCFNNGITFWRVPANVGNYSLNNH